MVVSPYASFHEDAMSGTLKPTNITITPHDQKAAKKLEELVQSQCRGKYFFYFLVFLKFSSFLFASFLWPIMYAL